ncbi:MAG: hypothetical protein ACTSVO_13445 [Candidatus Heimdallarchaeaceae archaeon]
MRFNIVFRQYSTRAILTAVENATTYMILYIVAAVFALVPLLTLLLNKYEPKGKTLEKIQEETTIEKI